MSLFLTSRFFATFLILFGDGTNFRLFSYDFWLLVLINRSNLRFHSFYVFLPTLCASWELGRFCSLLFRTKKKSFLIVRSKLILFFSLLYIICVLLISYSFCGITVPPGPPIDYRFCRSPTSDYDC